MKKTVFCLLFISTLFFTSCKKELQPQESSIDTTAVALAPADPNAVDPNPTSVDPVSVTPTAVMQENQPVQTASPNQQQAQKTAPGMNPPHGQPGHRCEIAVGAPLNSVAAAKPEATQPAITKSTLTPAVNPSIPSTIAAPPQTIEAAPGINPPHGQEGHDCAVAVGAPLPKK